MDEKFYKINNKFNKRIAVIADIHYSSIFKIKTFDKIIESIKKNKPHFICIPGDIIDDSLVLKDKNIVKLINFFKTLTTIAPVIISVGNHDFTYEAKKKIVYSGIINLKKLLSKIDNLYFLDNDIIKLENINFIGLTNSFNYYYGKNHESDKVFIDELNLTFYNKILKQDYNVLLCHTPLNIMKPNVIEKCDLIGRLDLIISGHTHNGMIPKYVDKIKGNKGLIGPFKTLFPNYSRGKIENIINNRKVTLIINGGITKISKVQPKIIHFVNNLYQINIDYIDI